MDDSNNHNTTTTNNFDLTMANNSSSEDEDLGAAFAKATADKPDSRAATRKKNNVVVPVAAPEADGAKKISAHVYGHNKLIPGQWFASRASASTTWNAHEPTPSNVHPGPEGAFSIIVIYDEHGDLNEDLDGGTTILFASTGASTWKKHRKTLKNDATVALDASIASKKPVPVLRAAPKAKMGGKKSEEVLYPTQGLRYDGLYRVVSAMRGEINLGTNGKYDAYCLKRLPIVDEVVKVKKAENQYAQLELKVSIPRCEQGYGGYVEGPPKPL
ncbi:uncharacterized protein CLAFUR5_08893 [Fulvia fulva]|uniref:YDG domain-containing protein n=1 Tax=Passalora fulva TaxID=5499 RepID=A0A9Q8PG94_PASFU|nr:uncharacterized protein CLAFUR5_08893 [Fulvia fulva]UJO21874.1 hypothetical protein CLAFUR5_08893 [Fulvia fulva]